MPGEPPTSRRFLFRPCCAQPRREKANFAAPGTERLFARMEETFLRGRVSWDPRPPLRLEGCSPPSPSRRLGPASAEDFPLSGRGRGVFAPPKKAAPLLTRRCGSVLWGLIGKMRNLGLEFLGMGRKRRGWVRGGGDGAGGSRWASPTAALGSRGWTTWELTNSLSSYDSVSHQQGSHCLAKSCFLGGNGDFPKGDQARRGETKMSANRPKSEEPSSSSARELPPGNTNRRGLPGAGGSPGGEVPRGHLGRPRPRSRWCPSLLASPRWAPIGRPRQALGGLHVGSRSEQLKLDVAFFFLSFFFPYQNMAEHLIHERQLWVYFFPTLTLEKASSEIQAKKRNAAPPSPRRTQNTRILTNRGRGPQNPEPASGCGGESLQIRGEAGPSRTHGPGASIIPTRLPAPAKGTITGEAGGSSKGAIVN